MPTCFRTLSATTSSTAVRNKEPRLFTSNLEMRELGDDTNF